MFDERNDMWIRIFKGMAIVEFVGMIIAGLMLAINLEMFLWFLVGLIAAFVTLPLNMLMIQFFSNVQMIRENVEYIRVHGTGGQSAPVAQQPAYYAAPVNASVASDHASAAPAAPAEDVTRLSDTRREELRTIFLDNAITTMTTMLTAPAAQ